MLKLAPVIEIAVMTMSVVPLSVKTTDSVWGEPIVTFPKLTLVELGES